MEKYLMTIDAGTGSVRAVIFNTEGVEIACSSREWIHEEDPRYKGAINFDVKKNWLLAIECIREVMKNSNINPNNLLGITTTSMREAFVLYDENFKEIWACANVDSRAIEETKELKNSNPSSEKEVYNLTGQTFALSSIPRLLWIKKHLPDIYSKIYRISMLNDWLVFKLSNSLGSEASNSSTTGIFNIFKNNWDNDITKKFDLKDSIFPKTYHSGELIGHVPPEIADILNIKEGTPVFTGGGDAQFGSVGIGLIHDQQAAVFGGSFWQYELNSSNPMLDKEARVRINSHAIDKIWQYEAIAFFPGLIMRWFRDGFCQEEKNESKKTGEDAYSLITEKVKDIPIGSNGLICTFSNIMNFISWKHASPTFTNFSFDSSKFNKYTFVRAIMENSCYVTKGHTLLVKELTGTLPEEIIFASGAAKNPLWCQMLADILNIRIKVPVVKEATALGGAILIATTLGIYPSLEEACKKMIKFESVYTPIHENVELYEKYYSKWIEVYKAQLEIADKNLVDHMWIAPGL